VITLHRIQLVLFTPQKFALTPLLIMGSEKRQDRVAYCDTRVYPKVSGLAAWRENCKSYSSLPLGATVLLFSEFCLHNTLCCFSTSNNKGKRTFVMTQSGNFSIHPSMLLPLSVGSL